MACQWFIWDPLQYTAMTVMHLEWLCLSRVCHIPWRGVLGDRKLLLSPGSHHHHQDPQIWRAHLASSQRTHRDCCGCRPPRMRDEGRTVNFCCPFSHVTILRQWNGPKLCALRSFAVPDMKGCRFTFKGGNLTWRTSRVGSGSSKIHSLWVIRGIQGQRKPREEMKRENCDFIADAVKVAKERLC